MNAAELLRAIQQGEIQEQDLEKYLTSHGVAEVGLHALDLNRQKRTGRPEVVFGLSKTIEQLEEIANFYREASLPLLITKLNAAKGQVLAERFEGLRYDAVSGLAAMGRAEQAPPGLVAIVTAGSSDAPVAEEAAGTLEFLGVRCSRSYDRGVAGLHRLLAAGEVLSAADVLIVVAGMEGALPSVVAGLFRAPVIAVPTSVGYGASFEGLAALLGMLNGCAPGVSVVNIDNGFGAAMTACSILQMAERLSENGVTEE